LNQETGKKCRNFFPDIRIHWLTSFQRHNNHAYACTPSPDQIASVLDDIGANGVGLQAHRDIVTATFLKQLRTENVSEFHMWTVDDPEDALFYISEGAFGITTNNPAALKIRLQSC